MDFPSDISVRIERLIEVKCRDSLTSHMRQIFLSEHQEKICGSFKDNKISIWTSSNRVIGICYPIVQLKFIAGENKIVLKSKMNQFGFGLAIALNAFLIWASLSLFILRDDVTQGSLPQRILGFFIFILIFNFPIFMSYRIARKVIINQVEETIKS